jgi:SAM-dependent methyltransferase
VTDSPGYVDPAYLDAAARLAAGGKRLSYERMHVAAGACVLDVGCGPATDTLTLASLAGPRGHVAGVDQDAAMVAEADRRAAAAGVADRVEHHVADATALPFADGRFDAVRCERLFMHLPDPEGALREMLRVTRPGGRVVVMDTDWGTRSVDTPETGLERRMARVLAERCLVNGYSGRRLYGMMVRAGLTDLHVDVVPLHVTDYGLWRLLSRLDLAGEIAVREGAMTADEVRRLDESWRALGDAGTFFALTSMVMLTGVKA